MNANSLLEQIQHGRSFLLANDGQYLGLLSLNNYNAESISNPYGIYGSQYSATSIFNPYSVYGSPYSALSPFNQYTSTPPSIYLRGVHVGFLTKNRFLGFQNVDPEHLLNWLKTNNLTY